MALPTLLPMPLNPALQLPGWPAARTAPPIRKAASIDTSAVAAAVRPLPRRSLGAGFILTANAYRCLQCSHVVWEQGGIRCGLN